MGRKSEILGNPHMTLPTLNVLMELICSTGSNIFARDSPCGVDSISTSFLHFPTWVVLYDGMLPEMRHLLF